MLLMGAYLLVIPGWSAGPGPEPMNTVIPKLAQACVHGFRALGLRPSPGMTSISDFLTAAEAGRQKITPRLRESVLLLLPTG